VVYALVCLGMRSDCSNAEAVHCPAKTLLVQQQQLDARPLATYQTWQMTTSSTHGRRPRPKSGGGTKSGNYWFEKPSFFKPSKTSKVQILGFLFFYLSCNL